MSGLQTRAKRARVATGRRGVTLIEMLVAMAISLVMMAAVANLFAVVGSSVSASRASITLSEQLRNARNRLQADLYGMTAPTIPPLRPENGDGYFEIFEGMNSTDSYAYNTGVNHGVDTLTGDVDDVLLFTTRSKDGQPFVGKYFNGGATYTTVESQTAEVAWYTIQNGRSISLTNTGPTIQLYTIYRRALLVAPEYNTSIASAVTPATFFSEYDLSAHYDTVNFVMVLNTMSDLTKRENRFAHDPYSPQYMYPLFLPPPVANINTVVPKGLQGLVPFTNVSAPNRVGEDVVLTNVLSFDVRVFDPTVPLYTATPPPPPASPPPLALTPSDVGYWNATGNAVAGYGAFVDLGYGAMAGHGGNAAMPFLNSPNYPLGYMPANGSSAHLIQWSALSVPSYQNTTTPQMWGYTYDTWSLHYEGPGPWNSYTNYSSNGATINATNGFDDDNMNGVDDPGEYQYPAPYPTPLRGIQVKIRTYEPDSKQIREVTIVQDFVPQ